MAARFVALRDDRVTSSLLKPACLIGSCCGGNDLRSGGSDPFEQLLLGKSEVKADNFRTDVGHNIAHLVIKGRAVRGGDRLVLIESQFYVVGAQPLLPEGVAIGFNLRRRVTKEIYCDRARRLLPDFREVFASLFDAQQCTGKRSKTSGFGNGDDHLRGHCPSHWRLNDRYFNSKEFENAVVRPHFDSPPR